MAEFLPKRIARSFITGSGANEDVINYATKKGLGSPSKMLKESSASIDDLGKQLGDILTSDEALNISVDGKTLLNTVSKNFPDANLTNADIIKKLRSLVPLKAALVDKLEKGTITLKELHSLNSAVGKSTFKTVFDDPTVKAGKEVGSAFYHTVSDGIKKAFPKTEPIFADLSKEYGLNKALEQLIRRSGKNRMLTLRDIVALTSGLGR